MELPDLRSPLTLPLRVKVLLGVLVVICLLMAAAGIKAAFFTPAKVIDHWQPAPAPQVIKDVRTVTVPGPTRVVVLDKRPAVERLKLDPSIIDRPDVQVTGAASVDKYEGKQTVVVMQNMTSGKTEVQVRKEPLPWFQLTNTGHIAVRYGLAGNTRSGNMPVQAAQVEGSWQFAQIKRVGLEVAGTADTSGACFIGAGLAYRW